MSCISIPVQGSSKVSQNKISSHSKCLLKKSKRKHKRDVFESEYRKFHRYEIARHQRELKPGTVIIHTNYICY